mgnify:CR=1 FL=1
MLREQHQMKAQAVQDMVLALAEMDGLVRESAPTAAPDAPVATETYMPVYFKPGEPMTLDEYDGQEHIVGYFKDAIRGLTPGIGALEPQILLGFAGSGKTLLAKIVANELRMRAVAECRPEPMFIETFPADLPDVDALDTLMRRVIAHPGSVVLRVAVPTLE